MSPRMLTVASADPTAPLLSAELFIIPIDDRSERYIVYAPLRLCRERRPGECPS